MRKFQHLLTILFIGLTITMTSGQTSNVASAKVNTDNCTASTQTLSNFVTSAGDDVVLIVVISGNYENPSVTYNGQTLTKFAQMHDENPIYDHVAATLYYLKLGNVATDITSDIVLTYGFNSCYRTIIAATYKNVNQTTPLNNQDSIQYSNGTTALSLDIASAAGDMVMDFVVGKKEANGINISLTPDASQTLLQSVQSASTLPAPDRNVSVGTSYQLSNSATTNMAWTVETGLTVQLHVGVNIQSAGALPVELVNFQATEDKEEVTLHWQTASERINEGFEIERSQDGKSWKNIGFVAGNGTTTEEQEYSFNDVEPFIGQSYYRLKQIDYDGGFEYSDIVSVNYEKGTQSVDINLFPNPVVNELEINDGQGIATIYNMIGQPIRQLIINNEQSTIDVRDLPKGQYILHISKENGTVVTKSFVK